MSFPLNFVQFSNFKNKSYFKKFQVKAIKYKIDIFYNINFPCFYSIIIINDTVINRFVSNIFFSKVCSIN